jgi:hypothetical protein
MVMEVCAREAAYFMASGKQRTEGEAVLVGSLPSLLNCAAHIQGRSSPFVANHL